MTLELEGSFETDNLRVALIASRFNKDVTIRLLAGAQTGLSEYGVHPNNMLVVWVPGAFEIPLTAKVLADSGRWDALICLGAVIRGQTPHFEYVASEAARGIAEISRQSGMPMSFGVLTTNDREQAFDRAGGKAGDKGYEAALTAIQMVNLMKTIREQAEN